MTQVNLVYLLNSRAVLIVGGQKCSTIYHSESSSKRSNTFDQALHKNHKVFRQIRPTMAINQSKIRTNMSRGGVCLLKKGVDITALLRTYFSY